MPLARVAKALDEIREGRPIILVDDEGRENEGYLVAVADQTTPDLVNFMATEGRGLIYVSLTEDRAHRLDLPPMVRDAVANGRAGFTVSIEAREGVSTGISAADRATTVMAAVAKDAVPRDLVRPGHVFPLVARDGGVLIRAGHAEAAVDLARLAGAEPAGVLSEILDDDGEVAKLPDLERMAEKFDLKMVSIVDLMTFRRAKEKLVRRYVELDLDYVHGRFHTIVYRSEVGNAEHFAFVQGDVSDGDPVLVRMQTAVPAMALGQDLGRSSLLEAPMRRIDQEGRGVIVFVGQPGGGQSVGDAFKRLVEGGPDTLFEARPESERLRDYGLGAQILADLGVHRMRLLTNRPRPIVGLEAFELSVEEVVPMVAEESH